MFPVKKEYRFEAEVLVTSHNGGRRREKKEFRVTKKQSEWTRRDYDMITDYMTTIFKGADVQIIEIRQVNDGEI